MFLLCGKERIFFWCTEIGFWQTNLPLYRAESFVPNLLIIRDQIPRCKRRQTYQKYKVAKNLSGLFKWLYAKMDILWTEHCARSVLFTVYTFATIFLNTRGNIFPHVQFHFLVRPSFPTCAVPVLIFELSVPIFPHVQFHPNMHCPILPHVQFQQKYELATLGSCTVETPFNKRQFHKN